MGAGSPSAETQHHLRKASGQRRPPQGLWVEGVAGSVQEMQSESVAVTEPERRVPEGRVGAGGREKSDYE